MYTLRLPFAILPPYEMSGEHEFQLDGMQVRLCLEEGIPVLKVVGFPTEQSAKEFMLRVRTGFAFLMLTRDLAVNADFELQNVCISDDPHQAAKNLSKSFGGADFGDRVDGIIDGKHPAIYRSDGKFRRLTGGNVSFKITTPATQIAANIEQGMRAANPAALVNDPRLQTALELYDAAKTESTQRTRFLTLMMVLEALAEATRRPAAVQSFLDSIQDMLAAQRSDFSNASEERAAFDALEREIWFRREDSIRNQVRQLVLRTLTDPAAAKLALDLYDQRSSLVHEGSLPAQELERATTAAKDLVRRVLEVRCANAVGLPLPIK